MWWIREVEIPTNPDFDNCEIVYDEIVPGQIIALQLMCDIALGSEDISVLYPKTNPKKQDKLRK